MLKHRVGCGPVKPVVMTGLGVGALIMAFLLAIGPSVTVDAVQTAGGVDPGALQVLKEMTDYLGSLQAFTVEARNSMEVVLVDGQKLDYEAASRVWVERPNRVRSQRTGVVDEADFFYDGSSMTLHVREGEVDFYGVAEMPDNLDEALDILRASLEIEVPGADLLYSDAFEGLTWDVLEARYVGVETLGGVKVHHLAFRTRSVDFQVWVGDGDRPLPYKYVITSKWITGAPQFGVELFNWNVSPTIDDAIFTFTPPPGAMKVDFVTVASVE
ncbi:MAG TPA: DUF2092 domain-containing protein [Candidatus Sulfomarinibacteraceae bacterium]|nr:DUF2092 domain-containing protein [Candidatus Sulfomarinibacteraceae bacterium]